jgi:hypothetical protein
MESVYYSLNPWWEGRRFETGIRREFYLNKLKASLERKQIEVLIGSRRAGKTTLLRQFIRELLDRPVDAKDIVYLALDHPSLAGTTLSEHIKAVRKLFSHDLGRRLFLFFDEVQESPSWETELKALYDANDLKVFCSGSTSSLLQSQGGKLTGRQIVNRVDLLSFSEFVDFRGGRPSFSEDYKFERLADEFLLHGGYPENALHPSMEYLANLIDDILSRDIMRLFPVRKPFLLKELLRLLAASVGSRTSFNKLARVLGVNLETVKDYVAHLESAFLVAPLEKWTNSWSDKVYAARKIYLLDNGIKTLITGPGDEGAKAEAAVFAELRRRGVPCGYFAESEREVDFVIGTAVAPLPIEVKYLSSFDGDDRRYAGLKLFLKRFPKSIRAVVVTRAVDKEEKIGTTPVCCVPLWKLLLDGDVYLAR